VDEELRTCRAELVDAQKKCKAMETRMRKAETDSINSLNEKTAAERKTKSVIEELESALQEAKDEANSIRSEARNNGKQKADPVEQEKLQRERASALEQLEILKTDKLDLERKLSRKAAQCETLQEKLDNYMFSSEDDNLQLELATAKEDARRAKEQISLLKERMQVSLHDPSCLFSLPSIPIDPFKHREPYLV
jgi:predicted  nucleic acid-binding Zn-ribbon protein